VALYDLPEGRGRVETICALARRMAQKAGSDAKVSIAGSLAEALDGCRFVVACFAWG
jgi:alpha-galactosidase/6-phospho-beta-glucosidase family protein